MEAKSPAVYILASKRNDTLYAGVTSDLIQRIWQHRNDVVGGFGKEHCVYLLVYFEQHVHVTDAIFRERQLKKWNRVWKLGLIERHNSDRRDLWGEIICG
jgi:putative endonuclease